ncbi:MAG: hypothetical protein GY801_32075 [bacterium]|nr:hypothetical protein [bacterium]
MIDDIPLERLPTGMTCQFETVLLLYDTSQKASFLLLGWDDVYFQGIIGTQAGADFSQFPGYPWTQQWQKGIYGYHDIR